MGTVVVVVAVVLVLAALLVAIYSRRGSAIPQQPIDDRAGSPGAAKSDRFGRDDAARDELFDQRGER